MTFEEYVTEVSHAYRNPELGWRHGQAAFNILARHRPDISERIRTTRLDPFYRNDVLGEFYQKVAELW